MENEARTTVNDNETDEAKENAKGKQKRYLHADWGFPRPVGSFLPSIRPRVRREAERERRKAEVESSCPCPWVWGRVACLDEA